MNHTSRVIQRSLEISIATGHEFDLIENAISKGICLYSWPWKAMVRANKQDLRSTNYKIR
jgi:hypothetical protein